VSWIAYLLALAFWGLIIGAFARLALPGKDPMSLLETMLVGIGGSLLGGIVLYLITGGRSAGGFLVSLVFATLIVYFIRRRRGGSLTRPSATDPGRRW
jgi:uncharacterized membrane protein YeaQ/YmgE (transglycosylase-associated protein family)